HNAHFYQPYELIVHYCRQALRISPQIADLMAQFVELQTQRTPMLMCKSAERIAGLGSSLIQNYLLRKNHQQLDCVLLRAIVDALGSAERDLRRPLNQMRRERHSLTCGDQNLLDYYYLSASGQPQEVLWVTPVQVEARMRKQNDYYKAYWHKSRFSF